MSEDRWWRGFDSQIVDALSAGARVLDVGCGDGGLVERLVERGLDAVGVDPRAAESPRLVRQRVEEMDGVGRFDAVSAVMSLHHADLDAALSAITRLLRPGGHLFAYELAWEAYDARAAAWLSRHDRSGADSSVRGWKLEHANLHTSATIRNALFTTFDVVILDRMSGSNLVARAPTRSPPNHSSAKNSNACSCANRCASDRRTQ